MLSLAVVQSRLTTLGLAPVTLALTSGTAYGAVVSGPSAGVVHGALGPPTMASPSSQMVSSAPASGSRPSHKARDSELLTARSTSVRPSTVLGVVGNV